MQGLYVAKGASVSMWVKIPETDNSGVLFSFIDENENRISLTENAGLIYKNADGELQINNPETIVTESFLSGQWHLVAVAITYDGYTIYIDGEERYKTDESFTDSFDDMVELITTAPYFYLGYDLSSTPQEIYFDDVKIYKNKISVKDAQPVVSLPDPVYLNTFDTVDEENTTTIVGDGNFEEVNDPGYGTVFKNATGGRRKNYLLLPEYILSRSSETNEVSIGVWVNASYAGASSAYNWAPLFTAYKTAPSNNTNTWPMLALQYRGVVQVNCNGWCDFTDAQNVKGANALYHNDRGSDWLADHQWHYYTATFTETTAKVFFDGKVVNEWEVDGTSSGQVIKGLFSNGSDLKYICLGGNQAWDWADDDPGFMLDDIAVYNEELSAEQIAIIISNKK